MTRTFTEKDMLTARAKADAWAREVDPHDRLPQRVEVSVTITVTIGEDE